MEALWVSSCWSLFVGLFGFSSMIKRWLLLVVFACAFVAPSAFAARTLTGDFRSSAGIDKYGVLYDLSCGELIRATMVGGFDFIVASCVWTDSVMEAQYAGETFGSLPVITRGGDTRTVSWAATGDCVAGRPAGTWQIPKEYENVDTGAVMQVIQDPLSVKFDYLGCHITAVRAPVCVATGIDGNRVGLLSCGTDFEEDGNLGGSGSAPTSVPAYSPSAPPPP